MRSATTARLALLTLTGLFIFTLLLCPEGKAQTASWTSAGSMTAPRAYHTATLLGNGKVLVAGGFSTAGATSSAELYDPTANTWTAIASMTAARYMHTATLLMDGRVLVVGGVNSYGRLSSAEIYDPAKGTWTATGSMSIARQTHSAALLQDGRVLVEGGCCDTTNTLQDLMSAEIWDPSTGQWTGAGTFHAPHSSGAAYRLSDGTVLVPGGTFMENGGSGNAVDLFLPSSGGWEALPNLTQSRSNYAGGVLAGDYVLVSGGNPGGCCSGVATAELYDPATQYWTAAPNMSTQRQYHAGVVLANGTQLLVSGGFSCCNDPAATRNSAEIFDLTTKTWSLTASMYNPRYAHTLTLLQDGTVLAAGGAQYTASADMATAERYHPGATTQSPVAMTISSSPTGVGFTVAGTGCSAGSYATSSVLTWTSGSTCTITVTVPSGSIFGSWSDGTTANPHSFTAPAAPGTISFTLKTGLTVSATSGTPQTTVAGTAFASPLVATVKDSTGAVVSGATVTFAAPAGTQASGTFAGGSTTASVVTNGSGIAIAPSFTANTTAGSYTVTASVTGGTNGTVFQLTNTAQPPPTITATSGSQTAIINYAFANPLVATLKDGLGNPKSGVMVTFIAPASGASAGFTNGINTAYTDANGVATSQTLTANNIAGTYSITATAAGVTTPASYTMTNTAAVPASITATGGNAQSATINTAYPSPLSVTVKDASGNGMSGITVTFTAPGTGASVTFAGGVRTAVTNASGVATSPAITANATAGAFNVFAQVTGATAYGTFTLTNRTGAAASITATSGTPQSATVSTAFATPLAATVKDAGGNPVSGVTVIFAAPTSGASGTFTPNMTTALTNANGVATSMVFTANSTSGSYSVTATVLGVSTKATFALTNNAASSGSKTLVPTSYVTTLGSSGGQAVASSIDLLDESGSSSTWKKYVEFDPKSGSTYAGYQTFTLPTTTSPSSLKTMQVQVNYQGPASSGTVWTWQLYNWTTASWVTVGTNAGAPDWGAWKLFTFPVSGTLANYVRSSDGVIMVQLLSSNAKDPADIDYEAVVVTY